MATGLTQRMLYWGLPCTLTPTDTRIETMTHLLFAGHKFYPNGGISDLVAQGTPEELQAYFVDNAEAIACGNYIDNWGQIGNASTLQCEMKGLLDGDPQILDGLEPKQAQASWEVVSPVKSPGLGR